MRSDLTTEQKIDEIYRIVSTTEARRRRWLWFTWLKKVIIYGAILLFALFPTQIIGFFTDLITPVIMSTITSSLTDQKNAALSGVTTTRDALLERLHSVFPQSQNQAASDY